jgi:multiple antibiotic resistance protein
MELFLVIIGALLSVMNPFGTVPIFATLTSDYSKKEATLTAFKTALNVLIILLISFFIGKYILQFFGISINSLKIAGGLIIASSGFALLTGQFSKHKGMKKDSVQADIKARTSIALTPLAIPMIAGPGTISMLITYNKQYQGWENALIISAAIIVTSVLIYFILKSSKYIVKLLGASGINALSRIIGFIVISIGVEFIISAVTNIFGIDFSI